MNETTFNMALRQFLKEVGVTSQREIEIAVREAVRTRRLTGTETLAARALITIDAIGLRHEVAADIVLE